MARNRVIKPSFWSDDKVGRLTRDVRLLFIGMLNFADDLGVIYGEANVIKAKIFPHDDIESKQVKEWLKDLVDIGMIAPIQFDNKQFYAIVNFGKHQTINRPNTRDTNIPNELLPTLISQNRKTAKSRRVTEQQKKDQIKTVKVEVVEDASFENFKKWCNEHAPNVLKMAQPITAVQLQKLKDDFGVEKVCHYLEQMNNWKPLLTKCTNANKTLRNWIKRDEQAGIAEQPQKSNGSRRGNTSINPDYARSILERMGGATGNGQV